MEESLVPIGVGYFGAIYDQFRGRIRESVLFLSIQETGEAVGVFHRVELGVGVLGDIDVVWGDLSKGLSHAIDKHVINHSDFNSVEELAIVLEEVVFGGTLTFTRNGKKARIRRVIGGNEYIVIVRLTLEDASGSVFSKNWVTTCYNNSYKLKQKKRLAPSGSGQLTADPPC
jgi:hypothetical protein